MPAEPVEIPKWADTQSPATPSAGQQNAGWSTIPIPSSDTFNWLGKWTGRWVTWLKAWYAVEHNSDGRHTIVNVLTQLFVDDSLPIAYQSAPSTPSSRSLTYFLGSPEKGGWQITAGVLGTDFAFNPAGTPSNTNTFGATSFTATRQLSELLAGPQDASAGDQWVLTDIGIRYRENNAGDAVTIALYSWDRATNSARTVEIAPVALAATGANYASAAAYGPGGSISIDPNKHYWIEVVCSANGAAEAGIAGVTIGVSRKHLE